MLTLSQSYYSLGTTTYNERGVKQMTSFLDDLWIYLAKTVSRSGQTA